MNLPGKAMFTVKPEAYRGCVCRSCIEVYGEHHDNARQLEKLPPEGAAVIVMGTKIGDVDTLHEFYRLAYAKERPPMPFLYDRMEAFRRRCGRSPFDLEELYTWVKTGKVEGDGTG